MWWPALGALAVGIIGYIEPHTLGVGYDNIAGIVSGSLVGRALLVLVLLKLVSWTIALGSGTSGGTLAPLFTIGGGLGSLSASLALLVFPRLGIDIRVAGLVGMAAMFAAASRALLASVVFAFETTRQPMGLLPLLAGCSAAYLVSLLRMRHSIMTERLARRGVPVGTDYAVDYLNQRLVKDFASPEVVTLKSEATVAEVRSWIAAGGKGTSHQGFPVLDGTGRLIGVITRRDLIDPKVEDTRTIRELIKRGVVAIHEDNTLREAADHMVRERVGRLAVVARDNPAKVIGILSRSDLLKAHERRLEAASTATRSIDLAAAWRSRTSD
jgi:CBS domain-containing protein